MKVNIKNVVLSHDTASVTFTADVCRNRRSKRGMCKTLNLTLPNIVSIIKAAKEKDYEKCKDKHTTDFSLVRGLLLLNFDDGYNYICVISNQAIASLEQTAKAMMRKMEVSA